MPLTRFKFTSKQTTENKKSLLSFFFSSKSSHTNTQEIKPTENLQQPTSMDSMIPLKLKTASVIANKFNDSTWGLTYQQNKKTLILDLDNTLIYAITEVPETLDYIPVVYQRNGDYVERYVIKRPGVLKFLKKLSKVYNICVFTSAEETYAKKIIEATKISKYIYTLYDRSYCEKINTCCFIKNIWSLGFERTQALLIDDLEMQSKCQTENFVLIKPFEGDNCDRELYALYPLLHKLSSADDIRVIQKDLLELKNNVSPTRYQQTLSFQGSDDETVDLDEGCLKSCVRVLECRPKMMRTDNKFLLIESIC